MSSGGLLGQVAQLVEQGTENPRVGGSIPSLATFLFLLQAACGGDPCRQLCVSTAARLDGCLDEWGVTWEELDASSRSNWRSGCQAEWEDVRADLEARELSPAEDQCTDADEDLAALTDAEACDTLRVLYLPSP